MKRKIITLILAGMLMCTGTMNVLATPIQSNNEVQITTIEERAKTVIDYNVSNKDFTLRSDKWNLMNGSGVLKIYVDKLSPVDKAFVSIIGPNGQNLFHGDVVRGMPATVKFSLRKGVYNVYVQSLNTTNPVIRVELYG